MARNKAEQHEQLTAYLDGELSPKEQAEVERLLAADQGARALLDDLRRTSALVRSLPRGRAPENLIANVTARLERQALLEEKTDGLPAKEGRRFWERPLAIAATVALACVVGWLMWRQPWAPRPEAEVIVVADADQAAEAVQAARTRRLMKEDAYARIKAAGGTGKGAAGRGAARNGGPALAARSLTPAEGAGENEAAITATPSLTEADGTEATVPVVAAAEPVEEHGLPVDAEPGPAFASDQEPKQSKSEEVQAAAEPAWRQAAFSKVVNRLVVETDAKTRDRLVDQIEKLVAPHQIVRKPPDARIRLGQHGGLLAGSSRGRTEPDAAEAPDEVRFVLHVDRDTVAELIASMNGVARASHARISWIANDVRVPGPDSTHGVIAQLLRTCFTAKKSRGLQPARLPEHPVSRQPSNDRREHLTPASAVATAPAEATVQTGAPTGRVARGAAALQDELEKKPSGRTGELEARATSEVRPARPAVDYLTLAVSLRATTSERPGISPDADAGSRDRPQPASAPAVTQPLSQPLTQPCEQGASRVE